MHRHKVTFKARLSGIAAAPQALDATPVPQAMKLQALTAPVTAPKGVPPLPASEGQALAKLLAEWGHLQEEFRAQIGQALRETAQMSVELGAAIAERLVGAEIAANRQRLERIVLAALERMPAARLVTVRGHPEDLALLKRLLAEQPDLEGYRDDLTFRPEETLQRGQLKLEADEWFVEWDTQRCLTELRAALLEETFTDE